MKAASLFLFLIISYSTFAGNSTAKGMLDAWYYVYSCRFPAVIKICKEHLPDNTNEYDQILNNLKKEKLNKEVIDN